MCKLPETVQSQPNTAHLIASAQDDIHTYFRVELHEILLYHGLVLTSQYFPLSQNMYLNTKNHNRQTYSWGNGIEELQYLYMCVHHCICKKTADKIISLLQTC